MAGRTAHATSAARRGIGRCAPSREMTGVPKADRRMKSCATTIDATQATKMVDSTAVIYATRITAGMIVPHENRFIPALAPPRSPVLSPPCATNFRATRLFVPSRSSSARPLDRHLSLAAVIADGSGSAALLSVWVAGGLLALCGALTLAEVAGATPAPVGCLSSSGRMGPPAGIPVRLGGARAHSRSIVRRHFDDVRRVFLSRDWARAECGAV